MAPHFAFDVAQKLESKIRGLEREITVGCGEQLSYKLRVPVTKCVSESEREIYGSPMQPLILWLHLDHLLFIFIFPIAAAAALCSLARGNEKFMNFVYNESNE